MSNPIRNCLTYLRDHTIKQADEEHLLPPGGNLDNRVDALTTGLLGKDAPPLSDEDFSALRQIHAHPHLSSELKNRLFQVCVQTGLVSSESKDAKATEIASHTNMTAQRYVLKAMDTIPFKDHTEKTLLDLASLFEGVFDVQELSIILQTIEEVPEAERSVFISLAASLIKGSSDGRAAILKSLEALPKDKRSIITKAAKPFIEGITDGLHRAFVLQVVRGFPQDALIKENYAILRLLAQEIPDDLLVSIINQIDLLDPSTRIRALNIVLEAQKTGTLEGSVKQSQRNGHTFFIVLPLLFHNDPSLRGSSLDYLQKELSSNTNPTLLYPLAKLVMDLHQELGLHEEHAVFQETIKALTLSDPDARANPKNPYTIFAKLTKLDTKPLALHPPILPVDGQKFSVSLQPLLEQAEQIKSSTTFDQLPPEVTADTLKELFHDLDQFLAILNPFEKEEALSQIEKPPGSTSSAEVLYNALKDELLSDPYIDRLLHTTGPANERVPLDVMQLFTLLDFIRNQPNTGDGRNMLTEKEQVLLKMASSIRFCPGGKKEGIFLAYNWIKGSSATASSPREEVKAHLYAPIYQALASLLSEDTPLMRALTETDAIAQLSHQAIYVKNLIGKRVGLVWDVTFDQSTSVLYDDLVAKTPEQALEIFFRYFTPEMLIKAVQEQINRDLAATSPSDPTVKEKATALYHLFFEQLNDNPDYFEFDLDEDFMPKEEGKAPILKSEGVVKLLTEFGYLQEAV